MARKTKATTTAAQEQGIRNTVKTLERQVTADTTPANESALLRTIQTLQEQVNALQAATARRPDVSVLPLPETRQARTVPAPTRTPTVENAVIAQYPTLRRLHADMRDAMASTPAERRKALPGLFMDLYEHFVEAAVSTDPDGQQYDGRAAIVTTIPKQLPTPDGMKTVNFADAFTGIAEMLGIPRETGNIVETKKGRKAETIVRAVSDELVAAGVLRVGFAGNGMPMISSIERINAWKATQNGPNATAKRATAIRW